MSLQFTEKVGCVVSTPLFGIRCFGPGNQNLKNKFGRDTKERYIGLKIYYINHKSVVP